MKSVNKQTLPTLGKYQSDRAGCSLSTLTYQGTNADRKGGFWANPGVKFSATFLILRTVFQTKAIFMGCSSRASPCSPPLLILPFPLMIFLFYIYQVSLLLNNTPNATLFSQLSLFPIAIHFYFSPLLFIVPPVLTDPFSSRLAETWLQSHYSTVTAQGKFSSEFHLTTLAGPFLVSCEKVFYNFQSISHPWSHLILRTSLQSGTAGNIFLLRS